MNFLDLFFCVAGLILGMALLALVWFLFTWAIQQLFGVAVPAQLQNVLVVIVIVLMLVGLVDCIFGGGHFLPWSHPQVR